MTIARIGDKVYVRELHRCGCGVSTLQCEISMDEDSEFCCRCCDHVFDMATLKRYGLLTR